MKKVHLKIVLVTIFAALLSGCTWLNTETEGGISRGKLIVGMVAVGAGIAGIAHSDSDSGDTILPIRPTMEMEDDGGGEPPVTMMPDPMPLPVVGFIATSDTVMEGDAVVLRITSSIDAPAGGLAVVINIGVADATEFTSGTPPQCIGLVCRVVIAATERTALLTITPLSGDAAEVRESWTAEIAAADTYTLDRTATTDTFDITNLDLPVAADTTTLAQLNAYAMSVAVAAPPFRQGGNSNTALSSSQTLPIVEAQYNDASGNPQILTQHLQFAALGVWVSGNATAVDGFQYASLADNVVVPPITTAGVGTATYDIEGDAVYKGLRFYPDGTFNANFDTATISGAISVRIGPTSGGNSAIDDFGTDPPRLADGTDLSGDNLRMRMQFMTAAPITEDGFSASDFRVFFVNSNHFSPLLNIDGQINGRFHAGTGYVGDTAPPEMSGTFSIMDGTTDCDGGACELKGGFLGDSR